MSIIRGAKDRRFNFTQIINETFEDPELSLAAKGFIGYCLTKPPQWKFHISHLCKMLKEGEKALYTIINECIKHGYAYRYQPRDSNGKLLPNETVVSDSKNEIREIIKDIESREDFKKFLPLRPLGGAVASGAEVAPDSNSKELVIRKEEQQQAVAVPLKKTPQAKIYECLKSTPFEEEFKIKLTKEWKEDQVKGAVEWTFHRDNPPKKSYEASITYALQHSLSMKDIQPSKEESYEENKKYVKKYNGKTNERKTTTIQCCTTYIEFVHSGGSSIVISYTDKNFKTDFEHELRKNGFKIE